MYNIDVRSNNVKQSSSVRGNKEHCINYAACPICYGCRAYDSRDPDCQECRQEDELRGKKYNICNKDLHESWKVNKLISKNKIKIDETINFISGGNNDGLRENNNRIRK